MIKFYIRNDEAKAHELQEWFESRNAVFTLERFYYFENGPFVEYDIEVEDELVAIEFRLAFGAALGISPRAQAKTVEDEIMAVLLCDMTKEIDDQIVSELLAMSDPNSTGE